MIPSSLDFIPELYLVGGAVRDYILSDTPNDYDFATPLLPEEVVELCNKNNIRVIETGLQHGTVTVVTEEDSYEITTFRKDYNQDGRHTDVEFVTNITDDLVRRDFTINAMALDRNGLIIDPFGGKNDLNAKVLRTVGNPIERFTEDYLRLLRALRFIAKYNMSVEEETVKAIFSLRSELLSKIRINPENTEKPISVERVVQEITKGFQMPNVRKYLRLLFDSEIIELLIPQYEHIGQITQNPAYHPEEGLEEHIIEAVHNAPPKYRWHLLLHDVGKMLTAEPSDKGDWYTFKGHEDVGADLIPWIAKRLHFSNKLAKSIEMTTRYHMRTFSMINAKKSRIRNFQSEVGSYLKDIEIVSRADTHGRPGDRNWDIFTLKPKVIEPILKGRDLIIQQGWEQGPQIGKALKAAYQYQLDTGCTDKNLLLKYVLTSE